MTTPAVHDPRIDPNPEIERKLDELTFQVAAIAEDLQEQRMRRLQWDELRADIAPIAADVMAIATREFEDVQAYVTPEDLLHLVKRVARNTRRIDELLGRFESAMDLVEDVSPLTSDLVAKATTALEDLERRGYFTFASSGLGVLDRIVTGFSQEDVDRLADNVVLILETVKEMTQPEIMELLQRTAGALEGDVDTPSVRQLIRQMRDPAVKRGIARFMRVMQSVAGPEQSTSSTESTTTPPTP